MHFQIGNLVEWWSSMEDSYGFYVSFFLFFLSFNLSLQHANYSTLKCLAIVFIFRDKSQLFTCLSTKVKYHALAQTENGNNKKERKVKGNIQSNIRTVTAHTHTVTFCCSLFLFYMMPSNCSNFSPSGWKLYHWADGRVHARLIEPYFIFGFFKRTKHQQQP